MVCVSRHVIVARKPPLGWIGEEVVEWVEEPESEEDAMLQAKAQPEKAKMAEVKPLSAKETAGPAPQPLASALVEEKPAVAPGAGGAGEKSLNRR